MKGQIVSKTAKVFKRGFRLASLILVIILAAFVYWKYCFTYSEGYRAGLLQKFSKKGNIFKTYEGEVILSSVTSTTNVALASEKFLFSVTDDNLASKIDTMQGQFVIVHYKEKNGKLPWRGETNYLVDSVAVRGR
jgi:hypothetical protein